MKKGILILAIAIFAGDAYAQKSDLTSAILSYRKQDFNAAKNYVDQADVKLKDGGTLKAKDFSKFLYHKGLVYYSLYETSKETGLLDTATSAYLEDTKNDSSTYFKKSKTELLRCAYSYGNAAYDKYDAKEFNEALALFEKIVSVNASFAIAKVDTSNIYNASLMAIQANNTEKAIELNHKLIDLDPSNGEYHLALIKQIGKSDHLESELAVIKFKKYLNQYYNSQLKLARESEKDTVAIIKQIEEIVDLEPKYVFIKYGRIMVPDHSGLIFEEVNYYLANNNNEELLKSLEIAIQADSSNKILYFAKGSSLGTLKRYKEAKAAYEMAVEIDVDYFDAYNNLASIFLDQTATIINKMNALGISQADQKKYNSYKNQRNSLYKKAKPYLEEAVRIDNTEIQVLRALKDICYQTDDIDCWKKTNKQIKLLGDLSDKPNPPYGEPSSKSLYVSDNIILLSYTYNCYNNKFLKIEYTKKDGEWKQSGLFETDNSICN